jgi:nicotinate phosphoribosyltransferase
MQGGKIVAPSPSIQEIQKRTRIDLARLPGSYRRLKNAEVFPVKHSDQLEAKRTILKKRLAQEK